MRQERTAGHQVDIGVAREPEHRDHAAGGTDRRHDKASAEEGAQCRRHRTRVVERRDRDEGEDVGRHRHRQQQRPGEEAAPGEVAGRGQPGERGAERHGDRDHADDQHSGVRRHAREHVFGQVRPECRIGPGRAVDDGREHGDHRQRDQDRGDRRAGARVRGVHGPVDAVSASRRGRSASLPRAASCRSGRR